MTPLQRRLIAKFSCFTTAEFVCAVRGSLAYDPTHPLPAEYHDPYAPAFCHFPWKLAFLLPPLTLPLFRMLCRPTITTGSVLLLRALLMERYLQAAIDRGVDQYVMVAAGMDSFILRRPQLAQHLKVFELDLKSTQDKKRNCLKRLGVSLPDNHHLVATDLTTTSLWQSLADTSFDSEKPALFSMLGLSYYLEERVFYKTLKQLVEHFAHGSVVVFDYLLDDAALDAEQQASKHHIKGLVSAYGEPMIFDTSSEKLRRSLKDLGLSELGHDFIEDLYDEFQLVGHSTAQRTCYAVGAWLTEPSASSKKKPKPRAKPQTASSDAAG